MSVRVYNTDGKLIAPEMAEPQESIVDRIDDLLEAEEWVNVYFDAEEGYLLHRFMMTIYEDGRPPRANNYYLEYQFEDNVTPAAIANIPTAFNDLRQSNWKIPHDQLKNKFLDPELLDELRQIKHDSISRDEVVDRILKDGNNVRLNMNLYRAYHWLGIIAAGNTDSNVVFTTKFDEYLHELAPVVIELQDIDDQILGDQLEAKVEEKRREICEEAVEERTKIIRNTLNELTEQVDRDYDLLTLLELGENLQNYLETDNTERRYVNSRDKQLRHHQNTLYDAIDYFSPESEPSIYDRLPQHSVIEEHADSFFEQVQSEVVSYQSNCIETYLDWLGTENPRPDMVEYLTKVKTQYMVADGVDLKRRSVTELPVDPTFSEVEDRIDEKIQTFRSTGIDDLATERLDQNFEQLIGEVATNYDLPQSRAKRKLLSASESITLSALIGSYVRVYWLRTIIFCLVLLTFLLVTFGLGYSLRPVLQPLLPV